MKLKLNADLLNEYHSEFKTSPFSEHSTPDNVSYKKHFVIWIIDKVNGDDNELRKSIT